MYNIVLLIGYRASAADIIVLQWVYDLIFYSATRCQLNRDENIDANLTLVNRSGAVLSGIPWCLITPRYKPSFHQSNILKTNTETMYSPTIEIIYTTQR